MANQDYATFRIGLIDDVSPQAKTAAETLQGLQTQMSKDTKALSELQRALKNLKGAAQPNTAEIAKLEAALTATRQRLSETQQQFLDLGGTFGRAGKGAGSFKDRLAELAKTAQAAPGPIGMLMQKLSAFIGNASTSRLALLALAGATLAIGAAAVKAAAGMTQFAISTANARRAELLQFEAVGKLRTIYSATFGRAADKATDMQAAVDEVSASVSIARDKVAEYAMQLERSHVRGKNFKSALEAVATAASGWGEEQANQTLAWAASLAHTGQSVDKLTQRVKNQIGGVVKGKMLDLNVQQQKLAESQAALFADVDISGFAVAKKALNDLFSQGTNSGKVMKQFLSTLIQPLIDAASAGLRGLKIFFQEVIIFTLKTQIAWYRMRITLQQAGATIMKDFGKFKDGIVQTWNDLTAGVGKAFDTLMEYQDSLAAVALVTAGKLGMTIIPALWAMVPPLVASAKEAVATGVAFSVNLAKSIWKAIPALAAAAWQAGVTATAYLVGLLPAIWASIVGFGAMAVAVIAATWPFAAAVVGVWLLIKAFKFLWSWASQQDWGQIGINIIDGFMKFITSGKDLIVNGFKSLAEAGANAFKSVFKIGSPSKLMQQYGDDITAGLTVGLDEGEQQAQGAMSSLVAPPAGAPGVGGGAARGGSVGQVNITELHVHVGADAKQSDAAGIAQALKRELESILEGVAIQLGAPVT